MYSNAFLAVIDEHVRLREYMMELLTASSLVAFGRGFVTSYSLTGSLGGSSFRSEGTDALVRP